MSQDDTEQPPSDTIPDRHIVRRQISPDPETAEYEFLEMVAALEGCPLEELPSLYDELDHFVETLYERPPSPESQMEISFSYAGYRVTMDQRGHVKLVTGMPQVE